MSDDDEDEGDDDDDEDVQSEEAPSQTFTVGDLIEAMKTKKKIPVSQPSSVVNDVFHFVSLLIVSGLKRGSLLPPDGAFNTCVHVHL